ncbi:MAG: hypothetical protein WEC81_00865 [Patescibacteria group bacterium]
MNEKTINILGWVGVGLILLAYAGVSFNQVQPQSWLYQTMNLVGSGFIVVQTGYRKDYQPMSLNIVWGLIAVFGLISAF